MRGKLTPTLVTTVKYTLIWPEADTSLSYLLERDDQDAIDKSNILNERTRHAKPEGTYREPGDTEGLPDDTGRSSANEVQPEK
jgi:hypothetical protein